MRILMAMALALIATLTTSAQRFINLTASDVAIGETLPLFTQQIDLGYDYADSTYEVALEYPEFIKMSDAEVDRYHALTTEEPGTMPMIDKHIAVDRKRGVLEVAFVPIVKRDGKYQKLVSFKLAVNAKSKVSSGNARRLNTRASDNSTLAAQRYAEHSVLASGKWAKISVSTNGLHLLTEAVIKQAGFTDISKVKIYGYGGALQPESLTGDYLSETDDLREVATYRNNGRVVFHSQGPVSWNDDNDRSRNPYSTLGYYFITENDDTPLTLDHDSFIASFYPSANYHNTLYEVDDYAWYHGGRNLYDSQLISESGTNYTMAAKAVGGGTLRVAITADASSVVDISLNGTSLGEITISKPIEYNYATLSTKTFTLTDLQLSNTVTITKKSGGNIRLDYMVIHSDDAAEVEDIDNATLESAQYVYNITTQDHHADESVDMVIIIPTTQKLLTYAEQIAQLHQQYDGLTTRIVPADELYNEFSSGTPDANAYRRYMKMMYDRSSGDDAPRYLLLLGGCAYDNRLLLDEWSGYSADDLLLCYESEFSLGKTITFTADEYFALLDDEETIQTGTERGTTGSGTASYRGKPDVAVGRLPVKTEAAAAVVVNKLSAYMANTEAGSWQNTIVCMGDDGNDNAHMDHANTIANTIENINPSFDVKRVLWDAYSRETSSTGNRYPEVETLLKQYMKDGALVMNYSGHAAETSLSHELVLQVNDFANAVSKKLPLWVTAACDVMPYDTQLDNIGETALLNENGGAIAFFGTVHTVFTNYNIRINQLFTSALFDTSNGQNSIGEAVRLAKNSIVSGNSDNTPNKLQYALLGDPALKLAMPKYTVVVDSIGGMPLASGTMVNLKAGATARMSGHIADGSAAVGDYSGEINVIIKDIEKKITCRLQNKTDDGADTAYVYRDRPNTIYKGNATVSGGRWAIDFVIPMDISYDDNSAKALFYAVDDNKTAIANGSTEQFSLNGTATLRNDSIGPSVYCYLNTSEFTNGDKVSATPYFIAEISDNDGINASGGSVGHDIKLVIDGNISQTYTLNDYFSFESGSYQRGTVEYSIPELTEGDHTLKFTVWDILNNSSTSELQFTVVSDIAPNLFDIEATKNPATTSTSFRIIHDRIGSEVNAVIEVFDMSGRQLWRHTASETTSSNAMTVDWDLTIDGGRPLNTGVYLYRARIECDGISSASKAQKLIILKSN